MYLFFFSLYACTMGTWQKKKDNLPFRANRRYTIGFLGISLFSFSLFKLKKKNKECINRQKSTMHLLRIIINYESSHFPFFFSSVATIFFYFFFHFPDFLFSSIFLHLFLLLIFTRFDSFTFQLCHSGPLYIFFLLLNPEILFPIRHQNFFFFFSFGHSHGGTYMIICSLHAAHDAQEKKIQRVREIP